MDGPLQSLGFLFRYKMKDGGYVQQDKIRLSLALDPMGKVSQNASSLKPLDLNNLNHTAQE